MPLRVTEQEAIARGWIPAPPPPPVATLMRPVVRPATPPHPRTPPWSAEFVLTVSAIFVWFVGFMCGFLMRR
jgi:hypothetical protein